MLGRSYRRESLRFAQGDGPGRRVATRDACGRIRVLVSCNGVERRRLAERTTEREDVDW